MKKKQNAKSVESLVVSKTSTGAVMKHLNYSIEDVLKNINDEEIQKLLKRIKESQKTKNELKIGSIEKKLFELALGGFEEETVVIEEKFHPKTAEVIPLTKITKKKAKPDLRAILALLKAYLPELYGELDEDADFKVVDIDFDLIATPAVVVVDEN